MLYKHRHVDIETFCITLSHSLNYSPIPCLLDLNLFFYVCVLVLYGMVCTGFLACVSVCVGGPKTFVRVSFIYSQFHS